MSQYVTSGYVAPGYVTEETEAPPETSTFFRDNLLSFLPIEFEVRDVAGDMSAFLKVVAIPQDEMLDFIDSFTSIFDIENCEEKYLPYIAKALNYPLSDRDTVGQKRLQLLEAVNIYKRKGTVESFRILFYSLGYLITLIPLWTKDYATFERYPGTWKPATFNARITGFALPSLTITESNRYLRIALDGGPEVVISLSLGTNRAWADIAAEIDVKINPYNGVCFLDNVNRIVIASQISGENSIINLVNVVSSAYRDLGFAAGVVRGIDYQVPEDWPELVQNGGKWFPSPHFGIEVFSIKDYVLNDDEFAYIRSRIELIRPCHTVLEWIDYIKDLSDVLSVSEETLTGSVEPTLIENWWPLCPDRGTYSEYEYLRDGLIPNRNHVTNLFFRHYRRSLNNTVRRDAFDYIYFNCSREFPGGPPQMPDRNEPRYFRDGFPLGEPTRRGCMFDFDPLTTKYFNPEDEDRPLFDSLEEMDEYYNP